MFTLLALFACDTDLDNVFPTGVDAGEVLVCLDGSRPSGEDQAIAMPGTVVAIDENLGACTRSVTVEHEDGTRLNVGFSVFAEDGSDMTPVIDVAIGEAVVIGYKYKFVWGDVSAFTIQDTEGLVIVAEEGTWGGAIDEGDVPGLSVDYGKLIGSEETSCEPVEGHSVVFSADEESTINPFGEAQIVLDGNELTALAVAGWKWGEAVGCDVMDNTDRLAWVVYR